MATKRLCTKIRFDFHKYFKSKFSSVVSEIEIREIINPYTHIQH